jgi:transposase
VGSGRLGAFSQEDSPVPTRRLDPARERRWRRLLAKWETSGLNAKEFCAREGVTRTALAHWRKEIAARDAWAAKRGTALFIPVHVSAAPALEVALPSGRVVRVPPGFAPGHLRAVVAALEGPPC